MEEISITRDDFPNLFSLTNQLLNSGSYKTMLRVLASYDLQGNHCPSTLLWMRSSRLWRCSMGELIYFQEARKKRRRPTSKCCTGP